MKTLNITKKQFEEFDRLIQSHEDNTHNNVDFNDVIFSWFHNDRFGVEHFDHFIVWNDWDEGKANDPHWNDTYNEHSAIVFIMEMCMMLESIHKDTNVKYGIIELYQNSTDVYECIVHRFLLDNLDPYLIIKTLVANNIETQAAYKKLSELGPAPAPKYIICKDQAHYDDILKNIKKN